MPVSSRLSVATHILTVMAVKNGVPISSEDIAKRASTNAAVIRKILSMLNKAGITTSQPGAGGGGLLARKAADITLLDVYHAVETQKVFAAPRCAPDSSCPIGSQIGPILDDTTGRAMSAMEAELAKTNIGQIAKKLLPQSA